MSNINAFDPLSAKYAGTDEVVVQAIKREVTNILNSYVGWYDPFCELIQNALDAVDKRVKLGEENYLPKIHILINLKTNTISVTDNGVGFKESEYIRFLAPNESFKPIGQQRGHKGVGTTYLAYGFNYIQVATKTPDFEMIGTMKDAKLWLDDPNPSENPKVIPGYDSVIDDVFETVDRGTSMSVKCDSYTFPKDLSWMGIHDAEGWYDVLRVQTGLGQIRQDSQVSVTVEVIDKSEQKTVKVIDNPTYLTIKDYNLKTMCYTDIIKKRDELYRKHGQVTRMPAKYTNLEGFYDEWDTDRLLKEIDVSDSEKEQIKYYNVKVIFSYVYSVTVWEKIDNQTGIRKGNHVLYGGIQLAANNMPQGEILQIPLTKNIGRQNQANIAIHFEKCSADLGRKGFKKEITDLAKKISKKMMDGPLHKARSSFKANSGARPDLRREQDLANWKKDMTKHEQEYPLEISNPNFFDPVKRISITSIPTREQDVIALFNQLIAGGVIRGIKIMSTNERNTYDGLYRVVVSEPKELQIFDEEKNPLGIDVPVYETLLNDRPEFISDPKVLEYKYSLDGLIEDIESGTKNSNDINLVIAWEAGTKYSSNYRIESYLVNGNEILRNYHGTTHALHDINTNELVCEAIFLKDLIMYLNGDPKLIELQDTYDE